MKEQILRIIYLIIYQFGQIFPYWLGGVLAGSLISVFLAGRIKNAVSAMDDKRYSPVAAVLASILGIASPVCMYGTIPLIASLGRKGVPQYILATFMVSSILLNPNLLLLSFALGAKAALVRLLACILAGLAAGLLVRLAFGNGGVFSFESFGPGGSDRPDRQEMTARRLLKDINKSITITAPYFLAGIALTALFDMYFPKELITSLFGQSRGLGVLFAASAGVPLYLCGGGTIPLINVWLNNGMSLGSATSFMISGPATKLTNLSAVKTILGLRNFIFYIIFSIGYAVIAGSIVDLFIH